MKLSSEGAKSNNNISTIFAVFFLDVIFYQGSITTISNIVLKEMYFYQGDLFITSCNGSNDTGGTHNSNKEFCGIRQECSNVTGVVNT